MADIIEGIHPTRMELLEINSKMKLASKGHKLLKEKRDSLIMEFFKGVDEARGRRTTLYEKLLHGYSDLIKTEALMSSSSVEVISNSMPGRGHIEVEENNIVGVKIPRIKLMVDESNDKKEGRNYSLINTSSKLDDTVDDFSEIYIDMLKLVESEETMRRLGEEIKLTKRRVNALEYLLIPKLVNTQKYIRDRLEELERENFFRLKMVKGKKKK